MESKVASTQGQAAAIGLIYDRTAIGDEPLASAFLVGEGTAVTIASVVRPYTGLSRALKIVFPVSGQEWGVKSVHLHPKFDQKLSTKTVERGTMAISPDAALQKYNCAVLSVREELDYVSEADVEAVSSALRYPLDLSADGFSGSLAEIEMPLVLQTLNNARKEGILYICDTLSRPVAQIFCQNGRVASAKYGTLVNESAVYQIVEKELTGKFYFYPCDFPAWLPIKLISMPPDALLIEAFRRLDELKKLTQTLKTERTYFARANRVCRSETLTPELREPAEIIWRVLDGNTAADQLWLLASLDDYTIFKSLLELYRSGQVLRLSEGGTQQMPAAVEVEGKVSQAAVARADLVLAADLQLNAFDQIVSLAFDGRSDRTRVHTGSLLGAIDAHDYWHLLHDIALLPCASGTPLFKNDKVIGMHCGAVPTSAYVKNVQASLQQMLWIDAVQECLKAHEQELPGLKSAWVAASEPGTGGAMTGGCSEIASIRCPGCGESTYDNARFCTNCGIQFVPDFKPHNEPTATARKAGKTVPIAAACASLALASVVGAVFYSFFVLPRPDIERPSMLHFHQPQRPWVQVTTETIEPKSGAVTAVPDGTKLKIGDHVHFSMVSERPCYVYLFLVPSGHDDTALAIYPPEGFSNLFSEGTTKVFPSKEIPAPAGPGQRAEFLSTYQLAGQGTDKIIVVALPAGQAPAIDTSRPGELVQRVEEALDGAQNSLGLVVNAGELMAGSSMARKVAVPKGYEMYIGRLSLSH